MTIHVATLLMFTRVPGFSHWLRTSGGGWTDERFTVVHLGGQFAFHSPTYNRFLDRRMDCVHTQPDSGVWFQRWFLFSISYMG